MIIFFIFLSWLLFLLSFIRVYKIQKNLIYFNASLLLGVSFLAYYSYPLFFNLFFSSNYNEYYRLNILNPTYQENYYLSLHILIGSSALFFSTKFSKHQVIEKKNSFINIDLKIFIFITIIFILFKFLYAPNDFSFSDRLGVYKFISSQNFIFRFLNKLINSTFVFIQLILIFKFFEHYGQRKKYIWAFIFIYIFYLYFTFDPLDQRSELFMKIVIIIISYNNFVKKINLLKISFISFILLYSLALWGSYREGIFSLVLFPKIGEFDMIYANFVEIYRSSISPSPNIQTKLYDLYAFIPQPLLFFEKSSLPIWFLENFHKEYYEKGGGYGFGILSESIIGFGLLETFIKIFILSKLFNSFFQIYMKSKSPLTEIAYIIVYISVPLSVRVTSFYFLSEVIQFSIIIYIIYLFIKLTLSRKYYG